jgi:hypothetical protein
LQNDSSKVTQSLSHDFLFLFVEKSFGFGGVNSVQWVDLVTKDSVDVVAEVEVVNKVGCSLDSVLLYQLLNFSFCESESECSET